MASYSVQAICFFTVTSHSIHDDRSIMAESGHQLTIWKQQFAVFDDVGQGKISLAEVCGLMKTLGVIASETEIETSLKQANRDSKFISFPDFVFLMKVQKRKEEMLKAFGQFDMNGDGYITADEIRHVMREAGDILENEDVDAMIYLADTDGDGKVNYEEFVATLGQNY